MKLKHPVHNGRFLSLRVRAKEDRCSEYALEGCHQASVLRPALLHAESSSILAASAKPNRPALLPNGKRSQKDWNEPILPPRQSIGRMSGYLKKKAPVSPLMQELPRARTLYRQSAQDERPGSEPEILIGLLPLHASTGDRFDTPELLLGDDQTGKLLLQSLAGTSEAARHIWHIPVTSIGLRYVGSWKSHASPPTTTGS
jgi:hypothetical protein